MNNKLLSWEHPISKRYCNHSTMVGKDSVGCVSFIVRPIKSSSVSWRLRCFLDLIENRQKQVRVVIAAFVLKKRDEPFVSHSSVDVLFWKPFDASTGLSIVFDEHNVPQLGQVALVTIHVMGTVEGFERREMINVNFTASAAP